MGVVKGFNPVLVYGGAYSTMSVQLINPNLNADLIGITFTDDMTLLGTGMRLANPVAFDVGTCGGTLTGNPGDTSFTFSGGILLANSSCTLTLHVVMNVNGNLTNRIPAGAVTTFNGISNPDPTEASLTNLPGVSVNKSFNPSLVLTGQPSILTITIANTSNVPVVNMGVADNLPGTLPDGVEIANPANASTTCGGTLTANPGAQAVQLVGGGLAAFGNPGDSCTITVSVLSTIPGVYINTIPAGGLTADGGVTNNNPASATLTVTSNYSLGNRVWYDTNNNNTIDFGTEVGIGGVRVELYQDNGTSPGVYDAGDTFLSFDDTDASGYYRFDNLSAGDYVVLLPADNFRNIGAGDNVPGDPLAGYWSSGTTITTSGTVSDATANDPDTDVDDSDENGLSTLTGSAITYVASSAVTLGPGASEPLNETDTSGGQGSPDAYANMTVDFGFYRQQLGNLIFSDLNNNGIFDTGDTPLASAVVQLYSSNGTEINVGPDGILGTSDDASGGVTTGAGGTYQFSGLPEGDYIVRVTPPTSSYTSTIDTADIADSASPNTNTDNNDNGIGIASGAVVSNAVTLTPSSVGAQNNNTVNNLTGTTTNPTVDFGFNASAVVTLGSTVFSDNNDNGLQDGSESGISGIRVELYLSSQTPGVDTPLAFDITDTNGDYFFDGLSAGSYIVYIPTPPASAPLSSNPGVTDTNDNSEDGDDNGSQVASGQPVVSPVITLTIGGETINEPNQGGTQDNANDANGDMTIDFGFVPTSALVADPALSKAGSPTQASVGDTIVFTITVTNTGNAPASGVVVTDPLPAMFDVTAVNASFNNPPAVPPTITVTPPIGTGPAPYTVVVALGSDLGVTDVVTITITTVVNSQGNPPITNVASLTTTSPSDVTANNVDAVTITVNGSGGNTGLPALLPATGFAPGVTTAIPQQPQDQAYAATDIVLEIPSIGVKATIVGVPKKNGAWDVSWLGKQVGWLEGSAFPSWSGNSVLTGHVYDSNGLPGPFVNLHKLKYGDKVIIHAYGQRYIFEVRTNQVVDPNDTSAFKHEDKSWLTLITCKEYDEKTNTYKKRVVVRAVLVKVEWDR
jgi:LPXTG-site transpeptidase (sortase) family protein